MRHKFISRLRERAKNEKGASTTIEFLFVIVFMFMFTMTVIDMGLYFSNRMVVTDAAQNGARLVSIYGGNYKASKNDDTIAGGYGQVAKPTGVTDVTVNGSPAEYAVLANLDETKSSTVNLTIKSIKCGPKKTSSLGDRTWCTIKWSFPGVPGSSLSFIRGGSDGQYTITESSNAEVKNE